MTFKYLEKDQKRIDKKLDELNQKYLEIEHKKEIKELEAKYNALKDKEGMDDKIWADIYKSAMMSEKKSKPKKILKK